jgi:hypothetical protein
VLRIIEEGERKLYSGNVGKHSVPLPEKEALKNALRAELDDPSVRIWLEQAQTIYQEFVAYHSEQIREVH